MKFVLGGLVLCLFSGVMYKIIKTKFFTKKPDQKPDNGEDWDQQ